jgi:CRISPR/Cas system-associated exonuclease Cas4 (RecB family)
VTVQGIPTVHATRLQMYKKCPRQYWYSEVLRFRSKGMQKGLDVGIAGHRAMDAYYAEQTTEPHTVFLNAVQERIDELGLAASEVPAKIWEEVEATEKVLQVYPKWAQEADHGFRVLQTEHEFVVPVYFPGTSEVVGYHKGRLDLITEEVATGHIWVWDHKFLAQFTHPTLLRHDEQMGWYLLAALRLNPNFGRRVRGVIYNMLRKQNPESARSPVFKREAVLRPLSELRQLEWNLYHSMRQVTTDEVFLPSPGIAKCTACSYEDLCRAQNVGEDPLEVGAHMFEVAAEETDEESENE